MGRLSVPERPAVAIALLLVGSLGWACGAEPVPPAGAADVPRCAAGVDGPALLRRHAAAFGSARDIEGLLPFTLIEDMQGRLGTLVIERGGQSRTMYPAGSMAEACGIGPEGPWTLEGGVRLLLRADEAVEPLVDAWLQRRLYLNTFDPARDEVACGVDDRARVTVTLAYGHLSALGEPTLLFDLATATLLEERHRMASGSTRGRKFSSWARRERVAEGSFSAVARGTPGARGASWPNETREEPWSAPRTLAAVEPRSVCFAPRASDGVMTETTGCLALPRDTLEVRLTSAAVRLRLDVGGDEIFVASDHGPAMIDSGAELLMLPLATADFRASSGVLVLGTRQTTRGERGETASLRLADDATAGAVTLRNVPTAVVPSFAEVLSRAGLQPSTAILGLPLLASVAMRVDYVKREVVLGAPPHRPGAIAVPLRYEDGHMVVDASLEGQSVALILDTGSGDGLSIDKTWADAHGLPGSRRHADVPMGEAAGMSVTTRFRLEHASFGPVAFDGRLADIHPMPRSSRYAGMLGNPMLERCHAFVLDLPARTLWLEGPCDRPVRERRGGFSFERRYATDTTEMAGGVRVGGFWEVATMMPGGPAARADLRVGDRILSMAGVRAPLRADDWVDVLSQAAGTVIGLKVERDGQPIALALRLDDFP